MIYKLPTQGRADRPYRGAYPNSIASASYGRGLLHVELNSGARYVALRCDVADEHCRPLGADFADLFGCSPHNPRVQPMSLVDYVGVLAAITLVLRLRNGR